LVSDEKNDKEPNPDMVNDIKKSLTSRTTTRLESTGDLGILSEFDEKSPNNGPNGDVDEEVNDAATLIQNKFREYQRRKSSVTTPDNGGIKKTFFSQITCRLGWANIRHIFNIRIMNIFDLLFEYSNIIQIFYVIKFYNIKFVIKKNSFLILKIVRSQQKFYY
jgi:hypothetical protein